MPTSSISLIPFIWHCGRSDSSGSSMSLTRLQVQVLFDVPADQATAVLHHAIAALTRWQAAYLDMRAAIEESGRDARWEFSKTALFSSTNYMAEVRRAAWQPFLCLRRSRAAHFARCGSSRTVVRYSCSRHTMCALHLHPSRLHGVQSAWLLRWIDDDDRTSRVL